MIKLQGLYAITDPQGIFAGRLPVNTTPRGGVGRFSSDLREQSQYLLIPRHNVKTIANHRRSGLGVQHRYG